MRTGVSTSRGRVAGFILLCLVALQALTTGCGVTTAKVASAVTNPPPGSPGSGLSIANVAAGGISTSAATITWTTNVGGTSQVEYGTTTAYGSSTTLNPSLVTSHAQTISGLSNSTTYHYRVHSKDGSNNDVVSGDFNFTTTAAGSTLAISNVAATGVTTSAATITWTTNAGSTSQVEYGTTTAYGSSTTLNPSLVTSHAQTISGLSPSTTYHYRVHSKDASNNDVVSGDFNFTTTAAGSTLTISNVAASGISSSGATITWTTNVGGTSQVEYGTTTAYGSLTTLNTGLVTSHAQTISGLSPSTTYHYRVHSKGTNNIDVASSDDTFTTSASVSGGTEAPVLVFSDLTSAPNSGNSDTSHGQTANVNGGIVSIYGLNLGTSQGTSTITVGGATTSVIYYWGSAICADTSGHCWSPANLNNGYQNLQMIIFQVPTTAAIGAQNISVTVNGLTSNSLPLQVICGAPIGVSNGCGHMYFVSNSGSDSNNGSFASPFFSMVKGKNAETTPGDITYVENGVSDSNGTDFSSLGVALRFAVPGTTTAPISFVSYPGASASIGSTTDTNQLNVTLELDNGSRDTANITIAKFHLGAACCIGRAVLGTRMVGNTLSAPNGNLDAGVMGCRGSNIYWYGNEWFGSGVQGGSNQYLYHVLYLSGIRPSNGQTESNRVIEWNYFHDNHAVRAINAYNFDDGTGQDGNIISQHHIDHNVILNQQGDGIMLGADVGGDNWIFDNLIMNAGQGPATGGQNTSYACIRLNPNSSAIAHVYNNTMYNCGFTDPRNTPGEAAGIFYFPQGGWTPDIHNNISYQPTASWPYIAGGSISFTTSSAQWSNNLWFGAGGAPVFDTNSVNLNPLFVTAGSNFHLQSGSPAIGSGSNSGASFVTKDMDGIPQPTNGSFDLGAYAYP